MNEAKDLFLGVNSTINSLLGVTNYRTKTDARAFLMRPGGAIDGEQFVGALFGVLRKLAAYSPQSQGF